MKVCGPLISGQVNCTLTITIEDDLADGVFEGDDIIVTLAPGTTGATYDSADVSGCGGAAVTVDDTTHLSVDPDFSPVDDCTIVVEEVLNATTDGEVCQTIDNEANDPPVHGLRGHPAGPDRRRGRLQEGRLGRLGRLQEPG